MLVLSVFLCSVMYHMKEQFLHCLRRLINDDIDADKNDDDADDVNCMLLVTVKTKFAYAYTQEFPYRITHILECEFFLLEAMVTHSNVLLIHCHRCELYKRACSQPTMPGAAVFQGWTQAILLEPVPLPCLPLAFVTFLFLPSHPFSYSLLPFSGQKWLPSRARRSRNRCEFSQKGPWPQNQFWHILSQGNVPM